MSRRLRLVSVALLVVATLVSAGVAASSRSGKAVQKQADTFTVGGTFSLTGPAATYGEIMSHGLQLGIDAVNAQGGAGGVMLKAKFLDMQGDAKLAALAAQKLISSDVQWISTHLTAPPLAQAPIAQRAKALLMNGAGNSPELATASPYLLSNVFLVNDEQAVLFTWAKKNIKIKRVAILHGLSYSAGAVASAKKALAKLGVQVVGIESHPFGAADQRPQIQKLIGKKPDTIYLLNDASDTLLSLKQGYELGYRGKFLTASVAGLPDIPTLPAAQTARMYTPGYAYNPDPELLAQYKKKKYKGEPGVYTAQFYDHALILATVLNYLKKQGQDFTGENIRNAILKIRNFKSVSGRTLFTPGGTAVKPMDVYQIKNGKWVIIHRISLASLQATLKQFTS